MTITTVNKDILTVTEGIIAHQVNMQGDWSVVEPMIYECFANADVIICWLEE